MEPKGNSPAWMVRALDGASPIYKPWNSKLKTTSNKHPKTGKEILYPRVRMIDGKLTPLSEKDAFSHALIKKDYLEFDSGSEATGFAKKLSNQINTNRTGQRSRNYKPKGSMSKSRKEPKYESILQKMHGLQESKAELDQMTKKALKKRAASKARTLFKEKVKPNLKSKSKGPVATMVPDAETVDSEKKWTEEERRKLYEEDPMRWMELFSGGEYKKSKKKKKEGPVAAMPGSHKQNRMRY